MTLALRGGERGASSSVWDMFACTYVHTCTRATGGSTCVRQQTADRTYVCSSSYVKTD